MIQIGDKIRFESDTKGEVLTVQHVSPWIDADDYMIETEEYAPGWTYCSAPLVEVHHCIHR